MLAGHITGRPQTIVMLQVSAKEHGDSWRSQIPVLVAFCWLWVWVWREKNSFQNKNRSCHRSCHRSCLQRTSTNMICYELWTVLIPSVANTSKKNNKKRVPRKKHTPNQSHVIHCHPPPSAHSGMAATPTPMPCELKMSKFWWDEPWVGLMAEGRNLDGWWVGLMVDGWTWVGLRFLMFLLNILG